MKIHLLFICFLGIILIACNADDEPTSTILTSITGKAQKGPFVNGSSVVVYELDKNLNPTGRSFNSKIINTEGTYKIDSIALASSFVQVEVDGLYYSELDGNVAFREITINSLVKIQKGLTSNVNLITQIENTRVKNLIRGGMSFEDAKRQSLDELIEVFSYPYEVQSTSEHLDLFQEGTDGIFLFCLSAVILATNDDYDAAEHASWLNFLLELEADFGDNGRIDSPDLENRLKLGAFYTLKNADIIREGFEKTIEITGASIDVPYFEPIIEKLFKEGGNTQTGTFDDISDFFPHSDNSLNFARLPHGTLITDEDITLTLEIPNNLENYHFSLEINSASENKLGYLQLESPAWSQYDVNENISYWSLNASITLPSNSLLGTVQIPFNYTGSGWIDLNVVFIDSDGNNHDLSKSLFWNTDQSIPSEIDTIVISDSNTDYIRYQVSGLDVPSYLIFENVETLQTLAFVYTLNLYGAEFPKLKSVFNEFTISRNPTLRTFKAPNLEKVEGYFILTGNPMIEEFETQKISSIDDYVVIEANNNLDNFNLGGLSFGDNFSGIMNGDYEICWVFNEDVLCDGNY